MVITIINIVHIRKSFNEKGRSEGVMKQGIKKIIQSPYLFILFMAIKLITYYILIGVNVFSNVMVMGSILVLAAMFLLFCSSEAKHKKLWFLVLYIFFSIIMYADSMYFNYYNQTVSVKQLWQAKNVAKVPKSFIATLIPASFIILIEIPIAYHYFKKNIPIWQEKRKLSQKKFKWTRWGTIAMVLFFAVNPIQSVGIEKINSVEFFSNHIGDIYQSLEERVSAQEVPVKEVIKTVEETKPESEGVKYQNLGQGKNLIVIQMESFQNFLIGASYNGQELTPNLNKLLQADTLYFNNYYSNIGKGNTADSEFVSMNSLYPVIDRECYGLYMDNTFNGLPWLMREQGYKSFAVHGYEETFWGRNEAYVNQGFQDYVSMEDMDASEIIGMGISDKSMFNQTIEVLKNQTTPYFSFIITLTNHHPYIYPEDKKELTIKDEDEGTQFANYLETAHYTDAAIGQFIDDLKAQGLYDNTVIALYGDHHGLNCKMEENQKTMSNYLGKTYDYDTMFNVPLIITVPGSGINETISTVGGQIDFLPTISNLMGVEPMEQFTLGQDLVNAKEGFACFTAYLFQGSFVKDGAMFEVSREGLFEGSRAWEPGTDNVLNIEDLKEDYERAVKIKTASREILDQNLISKYITHD